MQVFLLKSCLRLVTKHQTHQRTKDYPGRSISHTSHTKSHAFSIQQVLETSTGAGNGGKTVFWTIRFSIILIFPRFRCLAIGLEMPGVSRLLGATHFGRKGRGLPLLWGALESLADHTMTGKDIMLSSLDCLRFSCDAPGVQLPLKILKGLTLVETEKVFPLGRTVISCCGGFESQHHMFERSCYL